MMVIGDAVKHIKTGKEGVIVHIVDGCYFVQFDNDPSGCINIFVSNKYLEKIKGINIRE